jgi:hypothetical protein
MKGLEFLMGPKEIPVFSLTLPAIILTAYPKVFKKSMTGPILG